jgi:hypothetical protein
MKTNDIVLIKTPDYGAYHLEWSGLYSDAIAHVARVGLVGQVIDTDGEVKWLVPHPNISVYEAWWDVKDLSLLYNIGGHSTIDKKAFIDLYSKIQKRLSDCIYAKKESFFLYEQDAWLDEHCAKIVEEEIKKYKDSIAPKKLMRFHRGSLKESLATTIEVSGFDELKSIVISKYGSHKVEIYPKVITDTRQPEWWGELCFHIIADDCCVGFSNFFEEC